MWTNHFISFSLYTYDSSNLLYCQAFKLTHSTNSSSSEVLQILIHKELKMELVKTQEKVTVELRSFTMNPKISSEMTLRTIAH